jgi:ABC-2 type transport system permease protein
MSTTAMCSVSTCRAHVFVHPRTMPGWLQAFIDVNPVSHLVTAARGLIHGKGAASDVAWVLIACAALVAVFAPLTVQLYRRRN